MPIKKRQVVATKKAQPKLDKVKPVRLFEGAVEQIQSLINNGQLQPGDKLPSESELMAMFDFSRSSVREALRALEYKGLIEVRSGAGAFVALRPFSFNGVNEAIGWLLKQRASLLQLLQVREVLEGLTASLAANSISDGALAELKQILQEQNELSLSVESLDKQADLDAHFHVSIAKASGNAVAEEILRSIVPAFTNSNRAILYVSGNLEKALAEHRRIIDALASKDPAKAEAAIRSHITRVLNDVSRIQPEDNPPLTTEIQAPLGASRDDFKE
jgi:GntR family transcriptional repressor for pyruvate dehydrogenase complex